MRVMLTASDDGSVRFAMMMRVRLNEGASVAVIAMISNTPSVRR